MKAPPSPRSLTDLRKLTPARVAAGRTGISMPTKALLEFSLDHARARDAVHADFDPSALISSLADLGIDAVGVRTRATNRREYLRRPDLGRTLDEASEGVLSRHKPDTGQLALVIGDGLSPTAVHAHAIALLHKLIPRLTADQIRIGHVVVASGARVALGDDVGSILAARMVVMLIGERPGLSAPDSLGAYLTFGPRVGLSDAERNCVSNIHRAGLSYDEAAFRIAWLIREGLARNVTGVALKDESGDRTPQRLANSTRANNSAS
jgi:ethanolamine ammonia-lyase small subunit